MQRTTNLLPIAVLFAVAFVPMGAEQGTRITSGAFVFQSGVGDLSASGQSGFDISADVDSSGGTFSPDSECGSAECPPGTEVSLDGKWTGQDVRGTATLRGQTYSLGEEGSGGGMAVITFDGTVTMPPFTDSGTASVSAPFTFSGQLESEATFAVEPLFGSGVATLDLVESSDGSSWLLQRATYTFERGRTTTQH